MIYDCFTFFNELELLEIRLNILNDVVDKFVIVEANKTHSGKDKSMNFLKNQDRFAEFMDKIIYIQYDVQQNKNPWVIENLQRNAIEKGLVDCKDDDIIIISDLDEIVNPLAIEKAKQSIHTGSPIKKFEQLNMVYYLNVINVNQPLWFHTKICTYKTFKEYFNESEYNYTEYVLPEANKGTTATKIRMFDGPCDVIRNGGWHFSFMGGKVRITEKVRSYAHQELMNNFDEVIREISIIIDNINSHNNLKDFVALEYKILPEYIKNNIDKYKNWLSKTPEDLLLELNTILNRSTNTFWENIFSIKNARDFEKGYKQKIICFLGIRFKINLKIKDV